MGFAIADERCPSPHAALTILWIRRRVQAVRCSLARIRGDRAQYALGFRAEEPA